MFIYSEELKSKADLKNTNENAIKDIDINKLETTPRFNVASKSFVILFSSLNMPKYKSRVKFRKNIAMNKTVGIDLIPGLPEEIEAPADIANSDKLDWIGSWNKSHKKEDAELNIRHPIQGKHHWLARIIIKLIKPFTLQAEYEKAVILKQTKIKEDLKREK